MTAKELFEKLGYEQKIYDNEKHFSFNGIQYTKRDADSEMQRVGMIKTKCIEFYPTHKEIVIHSMTKHRNGERTKSDAGILSYEEFLAVQLQVSELQWENNQESINI